jgi:signal transduction histidine kinase
VQLIDDLLDISRILRGKMSLTIVPVDLNSVILAALETVALAAEAKSIEIQTIVSPGVGIAMGDAGRLQQVVWNLLSNAVKFTPHGGKVTVKLNLEGNYAQIQVTDTGKGIQANFLPYVFEHFRQEDGATTRRFGGLGLGLAIARQIIELHGGTIAANSPGVGQGATFTVQIPLLSLIEPSIAAPQVFAAKNDLSGKQILVVDDEADSREFLAFVLEQARAIVTSVSSGIGALQAFLNLFPI